MLDISTGKIVRVILLAREHGPESHQIFNYISGLNVDEKVSLVALMWVGRETYRPDELSEAKNVARTEATAPTEAYLSGIPGLPEYLEDGLDALGIDVADAEEHL
jgi:hypothetical protein